MAVKKRVYEWFQTQQLSRQDHWLMYVKFVFVMGGFLASWYSVMVLGKWHLIPVWGFFNAMVGIQIMHDANHGAFSRNKWVNWCMGLSMDFIGGSSIVWRSEHNLGHHIHTNHDNDPDTVSGWPVMRFNPTTGHRWWHRYQHVYVWFMYAIVASRWYFNDFALLGKLPQEQRVPAPAYEWRAFWLFKAAVPLYMMLWPVVSLGAGRAVLYYLLNSVVSSYWFALQFAPTHICVDAQFPEDAGGAGPGTRDWATLQVQSSTNFSVGGFWATLVSGGLNYQIEHHLFPSISHPYYASISPIVQQCCSEYGVQYTSHASWFEGVRAHYRHLYRMGLPPGAAGSKRRVPPKRGGRN